MGIVWSLGAAVILTAIAATLFSLANQRKTKRKTRPAGGTQTPGATGAAKLWTPWASPVLVIASFTLLLILIAIFCPALWEWLHSQGKAFWLIVMTMATVALAVRYKPVWWLVIIASAVILLSTNWTTMPVPRDWSRTSLKDAMAAAAKRQAERAASAEKPSATRSRVTTKTIIARPDEWSDSIWIPPNHRGGAEATDCVEIKNGLGTIFNYCPGDKLILSKNGTPPEGQLVFRSLTGCNVEVYVEWEPK